METDFHAFSILSLRKKGFSNFASFDRFLLFRAFCSPFVPFFRWFFVPLLSFVLCSFVLSFFASFI